MTRSGGYFAAPRRILIGLFEDSLYTFERNKPIIVE